MNMNVEFMFSVATLREAMGNPNATIPEIREYLQSIEINRHAMIKLASFDAILVSPDGIIYGYRTKDENNNEKLSLFRGTVMGDYASAELIAEEIMKMTPITDLKKKNIIVEEDYHWDGKYVAPNGDKFFFVRNGAIVYLNQKQEQQLLQGDKSKFDSHIIEVLKLNHRSGELYGHQMRMYRSMLADQGITE